MSTVLLDTHVLHWLAAEPARISPAARERMQADELAVSDITWFELAWLAKRGRIRTATPTLAWLQKLAAAVRTEPITPAIAARAAGLPATFPRDPADRLIYATAIENGWSLITRDERLRNFPSERPVTLW